MKYKICLQLLFLAVITTIIVGCREGTEQSTIQAEQSGQSTTTSVHGTLVPTSVQQQLIAAIGGNPSSIPDTFGDGGTATQFVSTDLGEPAGDSGYPEFGQQNGTEDWGSQDNFGGYDQGFALAPGDTPYMAKCRAAGVPIPPPWGDAKWKKVGQIPNGRIFALDPTLTTILYTFQDPAVKGTCAALPRMNGTSIVALGIICQASSGKACFWDNKEKTITVQGKDRFQRPITDPKSIRPEQIADGDNLVENCTACHRGGNVFIVHNGTALEKIPSSDPDQSYVPISGQAGWVNPITKLKIAGNCQSCHNGGAVQSLGTFTFPYCNNVLMPSLKSYRSVENGPGQFVNVDIHNGKGAPMPPPGETKADYAKDILEIESACKPFYKQANQRWPW